MPWYRNALGLITRPGHLALLLFTLLLPPAASSVQVTDLYQAAVPIAGEEAAQRNEAIGRAFADMLVKVTGSRRIVSRGGLENEVENASRYVQQYSYRLDALTEGAAAPAGSGEPPRLLQVFFDAVAVDRLLTDRRLPVWSTNRPSALVWIGIEEQGKRRLLVPDLDPGIRASIDAAAASRGLPMVFPLMDLEDQGSLQVADLWGDFESNIRAASRRYGTDLILTGRLVKVAGGAWRGQWRLYQGQGVLNWDNQGNSDLELAQDGIQRAGDVLAGIYAPFVTADGGSAVRVRVGGIGQLSDFAAVSNLMRSQGGVDRVSVASVESDAVTFALHGRSGIQALEQGLRLGGLVDPDPSAAAQSVDGGAAADLFYRLR